MSYRSKRTFIATASEDSSLASPKSAKSSDKSTQKWGPFCPPTLGVSQTFGYISEPIKQSTTVKKPTSSTSSPSMVAPKSSMPESTSIPSKPQLQTSSKPSFSLSQPSSKPSQHSISSTLTGAPQPQRKTAESRWSRGPLFPNLIQIEAQKEAEKEAQHAKPHNATQQPHKATHQPQKVSQNSVKATSLPHKAVQQP
ncbi:hypothetical protein SOVF_190510, partial [Spinacia oleracea]